MEGRHGRNVQLVTCYSVGCLCFQCFNISSACQQFQSHSPLPSFPSFSPSCFLLLPGFADPYSAYGNTRAFLDYRIMGFRECTAEVARYMTSVEGLDMKDPLRVRVLNHLESFLAQRELAINAAVAATTQLGPPKVSPPPAMSLPATSLPYVPLTPPRTSPDHLSPPASMDSALPRFNIAFPTPIFSFAPTATIPVFGTAPSGFKPVATSMPTTGVLTPTSLPPNAVKSEPQPLSPHDNGKITKAPFRPWADNMNKS